MSTAPLSASQPEHGYAPFNTRSVDTLRSIWLDDGVVLDIRSGHVRRSLMCGHTSTGDFAVLNAVYQSADDWLVGSHHFSDLCEAKPVIAAMIKETFELVRQRLSDPRLLPTTWCEDDLPDIDAGHAFCVAAEEAGVTIRWRSGYQEYEDSAVVTANGRYLQYGKLAEICPHGARFDGPGPRIDLHADLDAALASVLPEALEFTWILEV